MTTIRVVLAAGLFGSGCGLVEALIAGTPSELLLPAAGLTGVVALGLVAAAYGLARLVLPARGRADGVRWAIATIAWLVFLVGFHLLGAFLSANFRAPHLVALVLAVGGVLIALLIVTVAVPLGQRSERAARRWSRRLAWLDRSRGTAHAATLATAALVLGLGVWGLATARSPAGATELGHLRLAGSAIGFVNAITDADGDGAGLLAAPFP